MLRRPDRTAASRSARSPVGSRISHSTPAGARPASRARSTAALGMAGAAQHAPFLGHQRKQMAGPDEIGRLAGRIDDRPDRVGPLLGRDAGFRRAMIDRHGEAGAQRGGVRLDHRGQLEPFANLGQQRHAKLPAAVGDHEVDDFGRHLFGGADEIAFVFAVFGIDDDDDLAAAIASTAASTFENESITEKDSRDSGPPKGTAAAGAHVLLVNPSPT